MLLGAYPSSTASLAPAVKCESAEVLVSHVATIVVSVCVYTRFVIVGMALGCYLDVEGPVWEGSSEEELLWEGRARDLKFISF